MMKWMREMLKQLNNVEPATDVRVARFGWTKMACVQHAPQARVVRFEAEREYALWIVCDTWLNLIGCSDSYHFNNWTSIISL